MSTLALTQCWYTRAHRPAKTPHEPVDGAFYAYCRHCRRPIFSMDSANWQLDGGFNVETLGDRANSFLSVDDIADGMTIARFSIAPDADEATVEAMKEQIRKDYGLDEDNTTLTIRDHRMGRSAKLPSPKPRSRKTTSAPQRPAA